MPSMWQQNIQSGAVGEFDDVAARAAGAPARQAARAVLDAPPARRADRALGRGGRARPRHRDRRGRPGPPVRPPDLRAAAGPARRARSRRTATLANRSLTLPEVEAVRAFNVAFKAERLDRALHARVMRFGAAQQMKAREPSPDEPRVEMPSWALDQVDGIARAMVDAIAASGVRVVGDIELLTERVPQPRRRRADRHRAGASGRRGRHDDGRAGVDRRDARGQQGPRRIPGRRARGAGPDPDLPGHGRDRHPRASRDLVSPPRHPPAPPPGRARPKG